MAKQKMGELLVRAGLIRDGDLRIALAQQKTHGGKLGEHLVRMHLLTEETLARALAQQLGLSYNDLSTPPSPAVVNLLPEKVAARLQALPTQFDARTNTLSVAVSNPLEEGALREVARITGRQVVAQVTPVNVLRRGIEHAYFGVEIRDEGTNEFQLVDIHGRGKKVYVGDDAELPELGTAELMPIEESALDESGDANLGGEHAAISEESAPVPAPRVPALGSRPTPMRVSPRPASAPSQTQRGPAHAPPSPAPRSGRGDAGEEALHMVMAIAELLIERGYFTRAELMRALRK